MPVYEQLPLITHDTTTAHHPAAGADPEVVRTV